MGKTYSNAQLLFLIPFLPIRIGTIHEDVTSDVLGNIGPWQWFVVFVCTTFMLPTIFNQYDDMFLLRPSGDLVCAVPTNLAVSNTTLCNVYLTNNTVIKCEKWHVKFLWLFWIKKSWYFFCDDKLKLVSTTMICRMGQMFGCIIFGLIADSFGRKIAIIIDAIAETSLCLITTFCDLEAWYRLLIFVKSLLNSANIYMGLVIICEIASNCWRTRLNTIVMLPRLISFVCAVPLANNYPNMETNSFIAAIFGALLMVLLRWTPESPQWFLFNSKIHKAEKLLYKAATKNGIPLVKDFKIRPINHRAYNCLDDTKMCLGILTTYNIRVTVLVSIVFWCLYYFQWSYCYVRLYSEEASEETMLILFSSIIVLGSLTIFLTKRFTLKKMLLSHIILAGVLATGGFLDHKLIRRLLLSISLSSYLIGHAILLNVTPRLFATRIRATLFGLCQATGQFGTMIGYLLYLFQPMNNVAIMAMIIIVTLVLAAVSLEFLDVDGRELPDVMEDMDYFSELSKPLRWSTQKTNSPSNEEVEIRVYSFGSTGRGVSQFSEERLPARPITRLWCPIISQCFRVVQRRSNK